MSAVVIDSQKRIIGIFQGFNWTESLNMAKQSLRLTYSKGEIEFDDGNVTSLVKTPSGKFLIFKQEIFKEVTHL